MVHATPPPDRDHHLFVGAVLFAQEGGENVPIRTLNRDRLVLDDAEAESLPLRKAGGISYKMAPKVSAVSARIEDLESEVDFTPTIDHLLQQSQLELYLQGQAAYAESERSRLESEAAALQSDRITGSNNGDTLQNTTPGIEAINSQIDDLTDTLTNIQVLQEETQWQETLFASDDESGNTVRISFKVSSSVEIAEAYAFAAVRLQVDDRIKDLTFVEPIGRLTAKPRRVSLARSDLQPGFEIKDAQVYLFSHGEEIPTNRSDKHFEITAQEAREFLRLSHLGDHRRSSTPARPAWSLAPKTLLQSRNRAHFAYPVRVDLDANGELIAVRDDGQIVPEAVRAVLTEITFLPAIENGKPVPSSITINPADFFKYR